MKKNISVNIFGTLYPIDEDAYELLQQYNENMRRYYSRMEDGDEIADDIEHRVAELLSELRSQGVMAITIEHVKEIITRIGDPQDLDDNDSNATDTTTAGNAKTREENAPGGHNSSGNNSSGNTRTSGTMGANGSTSGNTNSANANDRGNSGRQLFRDLDDKILGGVLSGLSHYLGIKEPIVLRVLMIVFTITTFSSLALIYIIAWILIPEAITPEDRLRMHGKPVSAKAINEELMRGLNSANKFVHNPQHRDTARGCFSALMKFVLFCFWGFFFFILGCILLAVIAAIAGISIATLFGTADFITITGVEPDFFNMMQWIPPHLQQEEQLYHRHQRAAGCRLGNQPGHLHRRLGTHCPRGSTEIPRIRQEPQYAQRHLPAWLRMGGIETAWMEGRTTERHTARPRRLGHPAQRRIRALHCPKNRRRPQ